MYTHMKNSLLKYAGLNALGTTVYITFVASLFFSASHFLVLKDMILIPIAMLLLFVLSAAVTGSLVLGRPLLWYLDGKKKEAVSLFIMTLGFLSLITILAFFGLILFQK